MRFPALIPLALAALPLSGDDGIWLFNNFPKARVRAQHGVDVSDEFLDRLRMASIRLSDGGSASFVSPRGLIFTNHHVASECIQKLSTKQNDYMKNGFWAPTEAQERICPDLEANILAEIEDVTSRVKQAAPEGTPVAEANRARKNAMTAIEKECSDRTKDLCEVVTLYSGGAYHLYRYKKYTDIRLVFAPEVGIAAFGGDPDNFTFPRYCLDFTFLRAYADGRPVATPKYLRWSKDGAREGEPTFVSGHPGTTGRLATMAELEFLRDVSYPFVLDYLKGIIDTLMRFSARSGENKRIAADNLFSQQNSFKAFTGFLSGLRDPELMARKRDEQQNLLAAVAKDPGQKQALESTLQEVARAYGEYREFYREYYLLERGAGRGSELFARARHIYRYAHEKSKPNDQRLREYVDPALPSLEQEIFSPAPIEPAMEQVVLANYLRVLSQTLGAQSPAVAAALGGRTPEAAAREMVATSKLADVEERKRIAGDTALADSTADGMIKLVRALDAEARRVRKRYEDAIEATITGAASRIAQARFAAYGEGAYPDATFTLRLSYGPAIGYTNDRGQAVPWATDFAGLYRRATGREPFRLPARWRSARGKLDLKTPFNFVTTCDTHGGNSGSPTVNVNGEIIGILFDGNIESLPNRFVYRDRRERSVHVASQAILEALRKVYGAGRVLEELGQGGK